MTGLLRRSVGCALVFALAVGTAGDMQGKAPDARQRRDRQKLDTNLRAALDGGTRKSQRVIIRVRDGEGAAVRRALQAHGHPIIAEHESLGALTAVVHAEDLDALAERDGVLSVSTDAVVRAKLLGLVGGVLKVVVGVVVAVVNVVLPSGADTEGPAVPPSVLRATLGVGSTWTGRGIGVAVIDSGLEMSSEFEGRVTAFYDFTNGGIKAYPYDDYGHGTHIASTIGGSGALSYNREYRVSRRT
jgi:hypothetical protein